MALTPADIEQKTFSTALRGYNLDEVDDFLDEIVRTMRKLHEELDEARATPPPAPVVVPPEEPPPPPAPAPAPAPVAPPPIDESALGKALIAAQETAERIVSDAKGEAQQIVGAAQNEADTFQETRQRHREEVEGEISRLDALVERVKAELAELSTSVGLDLEHMSGSLEQAVADLDAEGVEDGDSEEVTGEVDSETGTEETVVESDAPSLYDQDDYEFDDDTPDDEGNGEVETGGEDNASGSDEVSPDEADEADQADETEESDSDESEEAGESDSDEYFIYPEGDDDDEDDEEESTRP